MSRCSSDKTAGFKWRTKGEQRFQHSSASSRMPPRIFQCCVPFDFRGFAFWPDRRNRRRSPSQSPESFFGTFGGSLNSSQDTLLESCVPVGPADRALRPLRWAHGSTSKASNPRFRSLPLGRKTGLLEGAHTQFWHVLTPALTESPTSLSSSALQAAKGNRYPRPPKALNKQC